MFVPPADSWKLVLAVTLFAAVVASARVRPPRQAVQGVELRRLVLGALAITVFKLGFWGGITSVLAANLLGALGLAACVAMGPRQGMPQMPISRASFGYFGNYLPSILAWLGYIGWFTVEIILGSQLVQQFTNIPYVPAVIGLSIIIIAIVMIILLVLSSSAGRRNGLRMDQRICRCCGAVHPPDAEFCRRCGQRL